MILNKPHFDYVYMFTGAKRKVWKHINQIVSIDELIEGGVSEVSFNFSPIQRGFE